MAGLEFSNKAISPNDLAAAVPADRIKTLAGFSENGTDEH